MIVLADTEAHLRSADIDQKRLSPVHHFSSDATALERGCNREIIDRAAMPVIADHDGRNYRAAPANHPESTVAVGQFALDFLDRIVPRAR